MNSLDIAREFMNGNFYIMDIFEQIYKMQTGQFLLKAEEIHPKSSINMKGRWELQENSLLIP
ncbi:hypothetical protein METH109765_02600 [Mesobacillus thioparans]